MLLMTMYNTEYMYQELLGIIAGIIAFSAYLLYYFSILKKKTVPSRTTWWIWTVVGSIIGISYFFSGARTTIWVPLGEVAGPLGVAILSIWYGEGGWTKFDRYCIVGAIISLLVWFVSGSAVLALISSLGIDLSAALPTIKKIYKDQKSEDRVAWSMTSFANLLNIIAIDKFILGVIIYPLYAMVIDATILFMLWRKK